MGLDCFLLRGVEFSLRLGHARVLTTHCVVIHYARAASLPTTTRNKKRSNLRRGDHWSPVLFVFCLSLRATNGRPYRLALNYNHARMAVPWCRRLLLGSSRAPTPTAKRNTPCGDAKGRGAPRPTARKRGFLKKAPFETEKHFTAPLPHVF